ncbi:hypothetical protein EV363DRAFT_1551037 [Boletus edulis]|nr:hypothetical protein EV363DRAFT_1551037 [Boletus edulis]
MTPWPLLDEWPADDNDNKDKGKGEDGEDNNNNGEDDENSTTTDAQHETIHQPSHPLVPSPTRSFPLVDDDPAPSPSPTRDDDDAVSPPPSPPSPRSHIDDDDDDNAISPPPRSHVNDDDGSVAPPVSLRRGRRGRGQRHVTTAAAAALPRQRQRRCCVATTTTTAPPPSTSTMTLCHRYHRRAPTPTTTTAQRHHLCHSTQRSVYKHSVTPSTSTPHTTTRTTVSTKPAEMVTARIVVLLTSISLSSNRHPPHTPHHPALPAPLFLLRSPAPEHDVFFVDQLSTCIPLLPTRTWRVRRRRIAKAKQALYRYPMEYLEEVTTRQADTLVANSKFTARITTAHLSSITSTPKVVYPGINIEAYQAPIDWAAPDVDQINSEQPTLISLNRFEMKKNAALAIEAFALLRDKASTQHLTRNMRLVLAGGYDPRLEDNIRTLNGLVERARSSKLSFNNEDEDGMLPRSHANDDDDTVSPPPPRVH